MMNLSNMEQNDSCWLGGPHLVGLLGFVIIIMTTTTIIIIIIIIFLAVIKPKLKANDKSALVQIFFFPSHFRGRILNF
jgi:uncharacterized membrane protein